MAVLTVHFANLLLAALLVGAMFAVFLFFNPVGLDAATYVSQSQQGIRADNGRLPILGAITTTLTLAAAVLARTERTRFTLLLVAAGLFVAAGLITRFFNQPINAVIMTWPVREPPASWVQFRNTWWRWHLVRFAAGLGGLCLLILAGCALVGDVGAERGHRVFDPRFCTLVVISIDNDSSTCRTHDFSNNLIHASASQSPKVSADQPRWSTNNR